MKSKSTKVVKPRVCGVNPPTKRCKKFTNGNKKTKKCGKKNGLNIWPNHVSFLHHFTSLFYITFLHFSIAISWRREKIAVQIRLQ